MHQQKEVSAKFNNSIEIKTIIFICIYERNLQIQNCQYYCKYISSIKWVTVKQRTSSSVFMFTSDKKLTCTIGVTCRKPFSENVPGTPTASSHTKSVIAFVVTVTVKFLSSVCVTLEI